MMTGAFGHNKAQAEQAYANSTKAVEALVAITRDANADAALKLAAVEKMEQITKDQILARRLAIALCSLADRRPGEHEQQAQRSGLGGRTRHRQRPFEVLTGSAPALSTIVSRA
jgi:hypothetical protein